MKVIDWWKCTPGDEIRAPQYARLSRDRQGAFVEVFHYVRNVPEPDFAGVV